MWHTNSRSVPTRSLLLGYLIVILIAALPLFGHLDELPVMLYDEQRLATNSLEMNQSGNLIVTTYDGKPDYWNTKPPLMIWLQVASMRVLGNNELAIRLPSALAALLTCCLLFGFCTLRLGSPLIGICSVIVLCTSSGYLSLHGTRTGDYDSLLTLFTTAYCFAWFSYLQDGKRRQYFAFILWLLLAIMTKSIAGCLMLPALFIYTIWAKKLTWVLRNKYFYAGIALLIIPVAAYYLYRQYLDPGYFKAVWEMDLGGRYTTLLSYKAGPEFYLKSMAGDTFMLWLPLSIAGIIAGWRSDNSTVRRCTVLLTLAVVVFIAILSGSATKFLWYALPVYPLLSVLAGIAISLIIEEIQKLLARRSVGKWTTMAICCVLVAAVFAAPYKESLDRALNPQGEPSMAENSTMGFFMKDVLNGSRDISGCAIAMESYEGNIRWYLRALAAKQKHITTIGNREFASGKKIIAYQEDVKSYIEGHFETQLLEDFRGVHIYRIIQKKS